METSVAASLLKPSFLVHVSGQCRCLGVWGGQAILQWMRFSLDQFGDRKKHAVIFLWEERSFL